MARYFMKLKTFAQNIDGWVFQKSVQNVQIPDSAPIGPESARFGPKWPNPWFCADRPRICQISSKMAKPPILRRSAQNLPDLVQNGQILDSAPIGPESARIGQNWPNPWFLLAVVKNGRNPYSAPIGPYISDQIETEKIQKKSNKEWLKICQFFQNSKY